MGRAHGNPASLPLTDTCTPHTCKSMCASPTHRLGMNHLDRHWRNQVILEGMLWRLRAMGIRRWKKERTPTESTRHMSLWWGSRPAWGGPGATTCAPLPAGPPLGQAGLPAAAPRLPPSTSPLLTEAEAPSGVTFRH